MSEPLTIIHSDALSALRGLESESVQMCCTSPPYWGLRSYGTEPVVWGGEPKCDHQWIDKDWYRNGGGRAAGGNFIEAGEANAANIKDSRWMVDSICARCGAWRGELGLEPTPEMYVAHVVEIFRELKRVLRADGTLWLNLGDSYAASGRGGNPPESEHQKQKANRGSVLPAGLHETQRQAGVVGRARVGAPRGYKAKDLVGIPWMVAFALRADGWYLRSDIIWSKPNPMPESVTDRPTRSHEYIFLLSKSQKYFYDYEAIKEPAVADHGSGNGYKRDARLTYEGRGSDKPYISARDTFRRANSKRGQPQFGQTVGTHRPDRKDTLPTGTRNRRSVWEIATRPSPYAHFATFPVDLVTPCILAGAPVGGVVLDPFAGSGTTGKVAIELGRKAILIEPKAEYVEMIKRRCQTTIGLPITA